MPKVVMYTTAICPYCVRAKFLLEHKGVGYEEIRIDTDHAVMQEMVQRSQRNTVPQIFIDDHHVGGYDDLAALEMSGQLNPLLGLPEDD
jgi:glutaredoxin 3